MGSRHIPMHSEWRLESSASDYAQVVKIYDQSEEGERRYSPLDVLEMRKSSFMEIQVRTHLHFPYGTSEPQYPHECRRRTRLTNVFSKKWHNHNAALALYFAYYNFCSVQDKLKTTPAVAAGLTGRRWTLSELMRAGA
jgi:hypothetical protein